MQFFTKSAFSIAVVAGGPCFDVNEEWGLSLYDFKTESPNQAGIEFQDMNGNSYDSIEESHGYEGHIIRWTGDTDTSTFSRQCLYFNYERDNLQFGKEGDPQPEDESTVVECLNMSAMLKFDGDLFRLIDYENSSDDVRKCIIAGGDVTDGSGNTMTLGFDDVDKCLLFKTYDTDSICNDKVEGDDDEDDRRLSVHV